MEVFEYIKHLKGYGYTYCIMVCVCVCAMTTASDCQAQGICLKTAEVLVVRFRLFSYSRPCGFDVFLK